MCATSPSTPRARRRRVDGRSSWRASACARRAAPPIARRRAGWPRGRSRRCCPKRGGPARAHPSRPLERGPAEGAPNPTGYPGPVLVLKVIFWASLAALAWTHLLYPLFAAAVARARPRPVRAEAGFRPRVALVIAAYNEDDVIAAKLDNALALHYPRELLRIVVASDASSDATDEIVRSYADRGVELVRAPRGGKVNAQNVTVRTLTDVD